MKKKKTSGKSKGFVKKSKPSTGKDTKFLDPQHMELQKPSPNSLKEEAAAGSSEEQYFAIWFYKFRERKLVDAWPELESAYPPLTRTHDGNKNTEWRSVSRLRPGWASARRALLRTWDQ